MSGGYRVKTAVNLSMWSKLVYSLYVFDFVAMWHWQEFVQIDLSSSFLVVKIANKTPVWVLVLGSMKRGQPEGRRFLSGAGGAVWEIIIELLLGEVDGSGVNCICKLESRLWLIFFCFMSSVLLLDFLICQCIYRITGFCNILSSFFFFFLN